MSNYMNSIKIGEVRWACIYSDLDYDEYPDPKVISNPDIIYWVKRIYNGRTYTTSLGNTYELFDI